MAFMDADWWFGENSLLGQVSGALTGTTAQNKANKEIAEKQMEFQERMSSTAHQREVADLKKAGINPIMTMGGSGSSTPTGSSYQAQRNDKGTLLSAMVSTAMQVAGLVNNTMLNKAQVANLAADTTQKLANSAKNQATQPLYELLGEITKKVKEFDPVGKVTNFGQNIFETWKNSALKFKDDFSAQKIKDYWKNIFKGKNNMYHGIKGQFD